MLKPESSVAASAAAPEAPAASQMAGTTETASAALDSAALAAIAELDPGGQKGLVRRSVALFVDDSTRLLAEFAGALEGGDADSARRSVHTLKSTAANVGGTALAQAAAAAEQALKDGDVMAARASLSRLQGLRDATLAALAAERPGVAA